MDLGWLWCNTAVLSIVIHVPLWWRNLIMGETMYEWSTGHMGNLVHYIQFFYKPKTSIKIKLYKKKYRCKKCIVNTTWFSPKAVLRCFQQKYEILYIYIYKMKIYTYMLFCFINLHFSLNHVSNGFQN